VLALALDRYGLQVAVYDEPQPTTPSRRGGFNVHPHAIDGARCLEPTQDLVGTFELASAQGALNGSAGELAKNPFLLRIDDSTLALEDFDPQFLDVGRIMLRSATGIEVIGGRSTSKWSGLSRTTSPCRWSLPGRAATERVKRRAGLEDLSDPCDRCDQANVVRHPTDTRIQSSRQ
jgi:hypothetical protein